MYICIHINLNTVYLRIRKQVLNLYGKLFNRQCNVICPRCSVTSDNIAVHKLQYCRKNENVRMDLWQSLITHLNSEHVLNITELHQNGEFLRCCAPLLRVYLGTICDSCVFEYCTTECTVK